MSHARELPTKIDGISIFDIDKNIELYGGEPIPWVKNLSPGGLYAILDNYGPHPHGMKWGYWKDTLWIVDPPSEIHELLVETLADCLKSALFDFFHDKEFIFYRNLLQSGESRSYAAFTNIDQPSSSRISIYCEVAVSESLSSLQKKCNDYAENFKADIIIALKYDKHKQQNKIYLFSPHSPCISFPAAWITDKLTFEVGKEFLLAKFSPEARSKFARLPAQIPVHFQIKEKFILREILESVTKMKKSQICA